MRPLQQVQKIKNALELAGYTQAAIAEKTGKSTAMVSRVVRDNYSDSGIQPSPKTVALIEAAINETVGRDVFALAQANA